MTEFKLFHVLKPNIDLNLRILLFIIHKRMKLQKLIESLKNPVFGKSFHIDNIEKIINKLEEMNSMIEMEDVKNSFVSQLLLILLMRRRGCAPPFKKMHTVLSGPPGVGKTSMSILIAQVWDLLKIMDKTLPRESVVPFIPLTTSDTLSVELLESGLKSKPCLPLDVEVSIKYKRDLAHIMTEILDMISDIMLIIDAQHGDTDASEIPDFIKTVYSKSQDSSDLCQEIIEKYSKYFDELEETQHCHENSKTIVDTTTLPYIVLGRGDFVGTYQGHTSMKTEDLLKLHKGKIIIIEEAYTLFTDDRDSYGMEALSIINRYMDEHVDDYIFIFNGYNDNLESSIFKAQPGLKRRIQWTFNIEKYTGEGIFRIFLHQLKRFTMPRWKIYDEDFDIYREFFHVNNKCFPYYGGDTEKLILFAQLAYGELYFDKIECGIHPGVFELTCDVLRNAFKQYQKMNVLPLIKDDTMSETTRMMYS